jgi:hypothetical protein
MRMRITALVLMMGAATVPAVYAQDNAGEADADAHRQHHPAEAETDVPGQTGMMGKMMGKMMGQGGMMGSRPAAILGQKDALGLDESQIERLEALENQIAEMREGHMESMKSLRTEALEVLTDDQRSKLDSGMNGMMQAEGDGEMSCSMMSGMKEDA